MAKHSYKIAANATSGLEWIKASLEGIRFALSKDSSRKNWKCDYKTIEVEGKLDIYFKCKGPKNTEVKVTVTEKSSGKKLLNEKKVIIGDDSDENAKIGHLSIVVNPQ